MTPGTHSDVTIVENGYIAGPMGPVATALTTTMRVTQTHYFGNLPLEEVSGFSNEATGTLTTRGFTTAAIDIDDVQQNWVVVEDVDGLAVSPVMRLEASNYVPILRKIPTK
jgi:hypothetical protein